MNQAIYSVTGGMLTAAERLNVLSNNLANVSTQGFREEIPFEQVIRFLQEDPHPSKDQPVLGGTSTSLKPGPIQSTGRDLDLAIEGDGFFVIRQPDGQEMLTRFGAFEVNTRNELVTAEGYAVLDRYNKPVVLTGQNAGFSDSGDVTVDGQYLTTLKMVQVESGDQLTRLGQHFFQVAPNGRQSDLLNPRVVPKALEGSNVDMLGGLTGMITAQRSFDFQYQTLNTFLGELLKKAVTELPKPM